jgi:large subunit ribosomal protein L27e
VGVQDRKFGHALVVGIERNPKKVTKSMSTKKFDRKSRLKPFVKFVNYNHVLPTRFVIKDDLEFKNIVTEEKMANPESRKAIKAELKKQLQAR